MASGKRLRRNALGENFFNGGSLPQKLRNASFRNIQRSLFSLRKFLRRLLSRNCANDFPGHESVDGQPAGLWLLAAGRTGQRRSRRRAARAVIAAYEAGYTLFDNADIYCRGEAERILGEVLKEVSGMRERFVIVTKGGIRPAGDPQPDSPGRYDFSVAHIIQACEQSLRRLGIETIDLFMLHRPDLLADPEEVAQAFSQLKAAGKVRYFGVSNFRPTLVTALAGRLSDAAGGAPGRDQPGQAGRVHRRHAGSMPDRAHHPDGLEPAGGGLDWRRRDAPVAVAANAIGRKSSCPTWKPWPRRAASAARSSRWPGC